MTPSVQELTNALSNAGLARVAAQLAAASSPCIRLIPTADSNSARSRIGGLPYLPPGQAWPAWNGASLSHLCQIDLSEIAIHPVARALPANGILSFFYDPNQSTWGFDPADRGSWVVLHSDAVDLRQVEAPDNLPAEAIFPEAGLSFEEVLSLPSLESEGVAHLELSDPELDALCDFAEAYESPAHHLLGHPQPIQNDMELECQLVSNGIYCGDPSGYKSPEAQLLMAGARDWRLLLQLDSDDDRAMMWGDVGRLYFWIRAPDLAVGSFVNSWMVLQCG